MISLKKSFVYKDLCYLMSLWSVKLPDGSIQKIGHNVILCAPKSVGVHGKISIEGEEDN